LRANPLRAASALLAFMDPAADQDERLNGALLVAVAIDDISLLRSAWLKRSGE